MPDQPAGVIVVARDVFELLGSAPNGDAARIFGWMLAMALACHLVYLAISLRSFLRAWTSIPAQPGRLVWYDLYTVPLQRDGFVEFLNLVAVAIGAGVPLSTGAMAEFHTAGGDPIAGLRLLLAARRSGLDPDHRLLTAFLPHLEAAEEELRQRCRSHGLSWLPPDRCEWAPPPWFRCWLLQLVFFLLGVAPLVLFLRADRRCFGAATYPVQFTPPPGLAPGRVQRTEFRNAAGATLQGYRILRQPPLGEQPATPEPPRPTLPLILWVPPGRGHLGDRSPTLAALASLPAHLFIYDSRGFGENDGYPTTVGARADAEAALDHLVRDLKFPRERVILFGSGLGALVAVDLICGRWPQGVGAVVLEDPWPAVASQAGSGGAALLARLLPPPLAPLAAIDGCDWPVLLLESSPHRDIDPIVGSWPRPAIDRAATDAIQTGAAAAPLHCAKPTFRAAIRGGNGALPTSCRSEAAVAAEAPGHAPPPRSDREEPLPAPTNGPIDAVARPAAPPSTPWRSRVTTPDGPGSAAWVAGWNLLLSRFGAP